MVIFYGEAVATYEQKKVPKLDAVHECWRRGGSLVNYKEIQEEPSAQQYLDQLENGATAWIDGFAQFSPVLYWRGCYSITGLGNVHSLEMGDRSLFLCSKECTRHDPSSAYVGVKNTTCYCINSYHYLLQDFNMVNPSLCHISCSNHSIDSCGGELHMDLYGIRNFTISGQKELAQQQCVYFELKQFDFETHTASCYNLYIDGFACLKVENLVFATASCTNTSSYRNTEYCFKEEPSTWQEAYNRCLAINGRLTTNVEFTVSAGLVNHSYWTSFFRSFGLSEDRTSNSVCIAATKINSIVYFEPDDCSVLKYFLCKYNELTVSASVSHQPARLTSRRSSCHTRVTKSKLDSSIRGGSTIGYISLAVSMVALAVATVVIILVYKFRKWISETVLPDINSGHFADSVNQSSIQRDDAKCTMVSTSRHDTVPDCENLSQDTRRLAVPDCENRSQRKRPTEQPDSQIPLAEPSFAEEDVRTVELHHVYEGLSDDRQHATYEVIA